MTKASYYVASTDYQIENYSPVVHIFGRDEFGRRVHFTDSSFRPYMYVPRDEEPAKDVHPILSIDGHRVVKVGGNTPKDIGRLRENYTVTYESDVLFPTRWAIDNNIKSWFTFDEIKLEPVDKDYQGALKIGFVDIEVEVGETFPAPQDPHSMVLSCVIGTLWSNEPSDKSTYKVFSARDELEESQLLFNVATYIADEDFDILITYNNYDFPYMINRSSRKGISMRHMSPMKYIRATLNEHRIPPRWETHIAGRNYIDLWEAYKRFFQGKNFDSEKLDDRVHDDAGFPYDNFDYKTMTRANLEAVVNHNIHHVNALIALERFHQLIPYLLTFRDVAGCSLKDTLKGSKMFDVLMLRAYKDKFILPRTHYGMVDQEPSYEGAFVKEPPSEGRFGPYILIFDYASMYPTLVQRKNMSFETLVGKLNISQIDLKTMHTVDVDGTGKTFICFKREPEGVLPQVINDLINMRKKSKSRMNALDPKTDAYKREWNEQYGMKQVINAGSYGLNAYQHFRLVQPLIAEATTAAGREAVKTAMSLIQKQFMYEILGADTDSCFTLASDVYTLNEAILKGKEIEKFVNAWWEEEAKQIGSKYPMKIAFEKVARRVIYLKKQKSNETAKKRYALLIEWQDGKIQEKVSLTGVEAKRRDTAMLSRDLQKKIMTEALYGNDSKIVDIVKNAQRNLRTLPPEQIGIPVSLSRSLDQFKNPEVSKKALLIGAGLTGDEWKSGDRGFRFYTVKTHIVSYNKGKKNKRLKSETVALKRDDKGKVTLPPNVNIDWDVTYQKIVVNKVKNLLSACGMRNCILDVSWKASNGKVIRQKGLGEFSKGDDNDEQYS